MYLLSKLVEMKYKFVGEHRESGDPLLWVDVPGNEPHLVSRNLEKDFNCRPDLIEKDWSMYYVYDKCLPSWWRWADFPPDIETRTWSVIRHFGEYKQFPDKKNEPDHITRQTKELEIACAEGHDFIMILNRHIALHADYYLRLGESFNRRASRFGKWALFIAWRHPKFWWLYSGLSLFAFMNAYAYSRYWRTDRYHRYSLYEQDVNCPTPPHLPDECREDTEDIYWIMMRIPRPRLTTMYLKHQMYACGAMIFSAIRMGQYEKELFGHYRTARVSPPLNMAQYFLPSFITLDTYEWESSFETLPIDLPIWKFWKLATTPDSWFFIIIFCLYVLDEYGETVMEFKKYLEKVRLAKQNNEPLPKKNWIF